MSTSDNTKQYAWFSAKGFCNNNRIIIYRTKLGSNVMVSSITNNMEDSGLKFDDVIFLGEVESFVSSKEKHQMITQNYKDLYPR